MISADQVDLDFTRRFDRGLQRIVSAQGIESALLATARAAHELADAAGVLAVSADLTRCVIAMAEDSVVMPLDGDSALQRLVTSAVHDNDAVIQYRPLLEIELPTGQRLPAGSLLTVPFGADSGYLGLAFLWGDGGVPSAGQLALLPGLAWTACLALRSQRSAAEFQRGRAEQRSKLVDVQHHARNVLAMVRSIIRRSGQATDSQEEFASHLEGRIGALARTQGALIMDGQSGPELEDVIRTELAANAIREDRMRIAGPSLRLAPRAAETLALTVHELATNALKFGALTVPDGLIEVRWNIASATVHWSWMESNVHLAQTRPQRRGFGRELIERVLPYELGATTRFTIAPDGARCEIDLPINERTTAMAVHA